MSFVQQQKELTEQEGADWERNDFPIVCEPCLGENPYVRMMKAKFDAECKICQRPFTVFRWRNGGTGSYKSTQVCQTCAKLKNCCQSCILDLEFGLPTQIRDAGLSISGMAAKIPVNTANRDWYQQQAEKEMSAGRGRWGRHGVENVVSTLMRMQPYYERNRAHVCSFWLRGACDKGDACPYKHEAPNTAAVAAVASKYGSGAPPTVGEIAAPPPPADESITTVFIGGVDPKAITEDDLRTKLEAYGPLNSIRLVPRKRCAFAEYQTRENAERAVSMLHGRFMVNGCDLKLAWSFRGGNGPTSRPPSSATATSSSNASTTGQSTSSTTTTNAPPPPGSGAISYPSMDKSQLGYVRKHTAIEH